MIRESFRWLVSPLNSLWRWLDPDWRTDAEYLQVLNSPRYVWPAGVHEEARRKFAELLTKEIADQAACVERQAGKRDRLLTTALTSVGVIFAAGAAFELNRWALAPAEICLLAVVAYLLWCSRSIDRPVGITAKAFLDKMPETLDAHGAESWIMDSAEVTKAKFRAVSVAWGRHVNVASLGIALAFGYLVIIALAAGGSYTRPL